MLFIAGNHPQRGWPSRTRVFCAFIGARTLDGHRNGGCAVRSQGLSGSPAKSTCLRDARPLRSSRLRTKTGRTHGKSKPLPRNKFTHVNARAAFGIPAAPVWGCPPTPRERETSSHGFPTWSGIIDSHRRCRPPASEPGSSKAESMAGPLIFESICVSAGNTLNVTSALPHSNRSPTPVRFVAAGICEHLL
jgi:hypothetical protein